MSINDSDETKKSQSETAKTKEERLKAQKRRLSKKSQVAESYKVSDASGYKCNVTGDSETCTSQSTRVKETLSPSSCSQLFALKPRPPSKPKAKERVSFSHKNISPIDKKHAINKEPIILTNQPLQTCRTAAHSSSAQKLRHQIRREQTSDSGSARDQTNNGSIRCISTLDRNGPKKASAQAAIQFKTSPRTHRKYDIEQRKRRNKAACTIQQAWRRFCANRLAVAKACEEAVPNHTHKIMRASLTKPTGSKSSVLQSIYGNTMTRRGRVDIPLRTQSRLSNIDCVHLTDVVNQAKQYSYHLRPQSAGQRQRKILKQH